jgi:chemotaxis protein MotB
VRQRRYGREDASQERWLISYADFITLLFALFVVLFASAYRDAREVRRVSQAIHKGFDEMEPFPQGSGNTIGARTNYAATAVVEDLSHENSPERNTTTGSVLDIAELRRQLEAAIGQELRNHEVDLRVTPEGFVISLHEMGFFASGRADLLPGASAKIKRIATVLVQHGLQIRVEGHSDEQPIHNPRFNSNWELSTARAMAVLLLLINKSGLPPSNISVAGYAQYRPVASNATPEGRQMNRRVDLVVVGVAGLSHEFTSPEPPLSNR